MIHRGQAGGLHSAVRPEADPPRCVVSVEGHAPLCPRFVEMTGAYRSQAGG